MGLSENAGKTTEKPEKLLHVVSIKLHFLGIPYLWTNSMIFMTHLEVEVPHCRNPKNGSVLELGNPMN